MLHTHRASLPLAERCGCRAGLVAAPRHTQTHRPRGPKGSPPRAAAAQCLQHGAARRYSAARFRRPADPPRAQQRALPPAPERRLQLRRGLRVARGGAQRTVNPARENLYRPHTPPPNPPVGTRRHTYVVFLLWDASARTRPTGWVLLSTHKTKCNLTADGCSPLDGGNRCLPAPDPRLPSHSEGFPPLCQSAVQRKHFTSSVPCCFFKPKLES